MKMEIAPSILSADRSKLDEEVASVLAADVLHVDIMDGVFVPAKTFEINEIEAIKQNIPFEVHLMVAQPEKYIREYAMLPQTETIIVHVESVEDPSSCLALIKELGKRAGITLKPATPIEMIMPYAAIVNQVLVMTVEPGKGGQEFMSEMLEKVRVVREKFPKLEINVDGGITLDTIGEAASSGANRFVSGSFIFGKRDRAKVIETMRQKARGASGYSKI